MDVPFLEAMAQGGLVCDGAMGSLLYERGVFVTRNFDEVTLSSPQLVSRIHREYREAGAMVLESNTYGANRLRLARHGLSDEVVQLNTQAVQLLREACQDRAYLAGSIGPTGVVEEDLTRLTQEITAAFAEQAAVLQKAGCDLLIVETLHSQTELRLCLQAVRSAVDLPIVAHVAADAAGRLPRGCEPLALAQQMHAWGASAVGVNCAGPAMVLDLVEQMLPSGLLVSAMPNAGYPQSIDDRLIYLSTPENFGVFARRLFKAGVHMVGGCCGTRPEHIQRVSQAARMVAPSRRLAHPQGAKGTAAASQATASGLTTAIEQAASPGLTPLPLAQSSAFGALLGRKFVVSVEVNPHVGLDVTAPLAAARMLRDCGADVINVADGPRATVRMSNLALAVHMRQQLQVEVLLHVCCRDHNLLGLQSALLGAHALDLHNLVVITGDPPKVGDYPNATAVYDVDSLGLLQMAAGYNRGIDPAGNRMEQTRFVLATGVEPAAANFAREMGRLRQKIAAGANLIMTQPVYDPAHLQRFLEATADLPIAVLVGVLPLASHRNAEFIHHNIPGMQVPEAIRRRMQQAGRGDAARRVGAEIAAEALFGVREKVAGAYIMPPLGRYEMAAEILGMLGKDRSLGKGVPGRVS
jgi:methionine synthase I (cobalamin-dependent)/5,10-methylenetetrahydrofolate reductase